MKIVDCFPYFNEKELLELRISLLYNVVDQFIICDADHTHTGIPKEYTAQQIIKELSLPEDKIVFANIKLPNKAEEPDDRVRENLQRDAAARYVTSDSIIFATDCDEIMNPEFVKYYAMIAENNPNSILRIPMAHLSARADFSVHDEFGNPRVWTAGFVCLVPHLTKYTLSNIRESHTWNFNNIEYNDIFAIDGGIIKEAGWHFTWMGNAERLKNKFLSFNNSDTAIAGAAKGNDTKEGILNFLENYVPVENGTEPLGRSNHIIKKYPIEKLPSKIFELENVRKYLLGTNVMNYGYLYVNRMQGQDQLDLFGQLKKSVGVLKNMEPHHGSIYVFTDKNDEEIKSYAEQQDIVNCPIDLSRNYPGLIGILTEKIIQLKEFDPNQELVLLDIDTTLIDKIPNDAWDTAVLWKAEYYITQFRNLDNVLSTIPWNEIGIQFDQSFIMYNTGVIYIPKEHRKEICEKALWIVDKLNDGTRDPEQRYGSKLDEQIGLSIAIHDRYGKYGNIKLCDHYIHHYWEEKTKNIKWWEETIDTQVLNNVTKLPISVGILSWKAEHSLRNTLESYKKNGLFDIVDDVTILFQEVRPEDKKLADEFKLPYIGLDTNIGIGNGFLTLCNQAKHPYVLLLEDDWELTEDFTQTKERLKAGLDMLNKDINVVRLRNRRKPGFPLYTQQACQGRELEHNDFVIGLPGAHLFDCVHWIENPEQKFSELIFTDSGHYVTTSRYSNWTNNPCLYHKDFYVETVSPFVNNGGLLLEPEISHWWARQQFKVAWGEALFTHNDIDKHG